MAKRRFVPASDTASHVSSRQVRFRPDVDSHREMRGSVAEDNDEEVEEEEEEEEEEENAVCEVEVTLGKVFKCAFYRFQLISV